MLQCNCDMLSFPPPITMQLFSVRPPFLLWPTALLVCARTPLTLAAPALSHAPMATLCLYVNSYMLIADLHLPPLIFCRENPPSYVLPLASGLQTPPATIPMPALGTLVLPTAQHALTYLPPPTLVSTQASLSSPARASLTSQARQDQTAWAVV